MTAQQARQKIYRFCTYQERCHQEVVEKLHGFNLSTDDVDDIVSHLVQEGFLNEERFAKTFVSGKFRLKKWGRLKIIRELELKEVSMHCIKAGLKEIEEADYLQTITNLLDKKAALKSEDNLYVFRDKIASAVIAKGFEPELVWSITKKQFPDKR